MQQVADKYHIGHTGGKKKVKMKSSILLDLTMRAFKKHERKRENVNIKGEVKL